MSAKPPSSARLWQDLPREAKLLLSVIVVEFLGTGLTLPFNVVYLHEVRDFSLADTGVLLAIPAVACLILLGPAGRWIDALGPRRVLLAASAVTPVGQVVLATAHDVVTAGIGLTLSGFALGVAHPASVSMVSTLVPSDIRPHFFGVQFALLNLGIGLGGVLGGLVVDVNAARTFELIYLADAVSYVPGLVLLIWPLRKVGGRVARPEGAPPGTYLAVLRRPAVLSLSLLTFMVAFVGYGQLNSGLPAFARAVSEVSTRALGFAFAANTVVIVLFQLVVLSRIEGHRRTRVMAAMGVVWAVAWSLLALSGAAHGTFLAAVLVAGCTSVFAMGETLLQPTIPAIVNDLAPDHLRGRYNALSVMCIQSAAAIGPIVSGVLLGADLHVVYVLGLVVSSLLCAVVAVTLVERRLPRAANGFPAAAELATPAPSPIATPGSPDPAV